MNKQEWSDSLRALAAAKRMRKPVPERTTLSAEEEAQCQVIGGAFISWFEERLQNIAAERTAIKSLHSDPQPVVVFTTTMPGLVATREIITEPDDNLICLLDTEFQKWERDHPVDDFTFHIRHWNYFKKPDRSTLSQAKKAFPGIDATEFRIHVLGDRWGELCGHESLHLWRWNGKDLDLVEQSFSTTIY